MPRPLPIHGVEPGSLAERAGLRAGDRIVALNGEALRDVIDLRYHAADDEVEFLIQRNATKRPFTIRIERVPGEGLGIETEEMKARVCGNKCLFCFIDQMPAGRRRGLYVRDEDYRFSFLHGNYVTLTNIRPGEFDRIIDQGLSPLYVSVHATDPGVRARLLGIEDLTIADVLPKLRRLIAGGIRVHAQVVLCPGINDGEILTQTAQGLAELHPGVQSIAVVPLGLTRHRAGLAALTPVTPDCARLVMSQVEELGAAFRRRFGHPFIYLADEWFFLTGTAIPQASYYEDFPQIEDGVGLARQLIDRLADDGDHLPIVDWVRGRRATVVTGVMAAPLITTELVTGLLTRHAKAVDLVVVENDFLGPGITVAGLLAGGDIERAVKRQRPGDVICLPPSCVNGRSLFLDDMSLSDLESALGAPLHLGLGDEPFHTNPVWEKT